MEEQKSKLEQELRKKYGIAKTGKPVEPFVIPETEQTVRIPHEQLHAFKNHPFNVEKKCTVYGLCCQYPGAGRDMARHWPDEKGGYEIISGHRRDAGSMEAIKHQGAQQAIEGQDFSGGIDKRSNEVVAERNGMSMKQVQRYIAVAIDAQQSAPSLSQAQRIRKLSQESMLNGDVINGIMLEEKKEVDKVIISGMELEKYFGKEKAPQEMKDQIIKLPDDWKSKQKEHAKAEKKAGQEK